MGQRKTAGIFLRKLTILKSNYYIYPIPILLKFIIIILKFIMILYKFRVIQTKVKSSYPGIPRSKPYLTFAIGCGSRQNSSCAESKPYSAVPRPKGLPLVGTVPYYILNGGGKYLHDYVLRRHQELGPIYRERYSTEPFEVLFIGDVEGARDVYRNEGKTPLSFVIGGEELYIKSKGIRRGLLFTQGEEWLNLRRSMNHLFLKRTDYYDQFDLSAQILDEYLSRWWEESKQNPNSPENSRIVPNLPEKINQVGISTFGAFAFGNSFNKNRHIIEKDSQEFYSLIRTYWESNMKMQIIPPSLAKKLRLPVWTRFETAISELLAIGRKWTQMAEPDKNDGDGLLHIMLREYNDTSDESALRVFSDLIPAIESETTMIEWIIYTLGQNPKAQVKLYEEIRKCQSESLSWRQLDDIGYLTGCIKECLRLYPSNGFTVRILPQDSIIKGFNVPGGTVAAVALMSVQRDPLIFPNPDGFWPERWSRGIGDDLENRPIGVHGCQPYLPFAWGSSRGCVFRKISLRRMSLFLAHLVTKYSFSTVKVKPVMRTLLIPDRDIKLTIFKR